MENDCAEVIVKTLDFSSCLELYDYDLTRVVVVQTVDFLYENNCKITFCTDPSGSNIYHSAYIDIKSFLESDEDVSGVLKCHRFKQMCCSQFNGSQFEPDTDKQINVFTLRLSHFVDGSEVVSEEDSEEDLDEDSKENSDEDSEEEE